MPDQIVYPRGVNVRRRASRALKASGLKLLANVTWTAERVAKRTLDIVVALVVALVLAPVLVAIAILIKLEDRGPVLYWQQRVGRFGRVFDFPKFRSMVPNAETMQAHMVAGNHHDESITFKMKNDPRVTRVGRLLRRTSLDEMPQLWCVLRGDMSLVGPRPALPREVASYSARDRRRLEEMPGLTCIWQVSGRGDIPFPRQVELDVDYIETRSTWLDLKLCLRTVPAILFGKGAY